MYPIPVPSECEQVTDILPASGRSLRSQLYLRKASQGLRWHIYRDQTRDQNLEVQREHHMTFRRLAEPFGAIGSGL